MNFNAFNFRSIYGAQTTTNPSGKILPNTTTGKSVLTPIDTKGAKVKKKIDSFFFQFYLFLNFGHADKKEKSTFFYGTKPASHPLVTLIRAYQKVSIVDRKGGTYVRYYVHNIGLDNVTHTKELKRRETSTKRKSTYSPQKSTTFTKDKGNVHLKRAVPFLGRKKSFSCDIIISLTSHLQSREFGFHVL